jgi:RNA recognition motif-containing protein
MSGRKIFVGSLPDGVSEATLRSTFQQYGQIEDTFIKQGCEPGRQWAFITFATAEQAMSAKDQCDRALTFPGMDRPCDVMVARNQGMYGQSSDGGGGGGSWPPQQAAPPASEGPRKIFVGSLPDNVTAEQLQMEFSKYGVITDTYIKEGCEPGRQWAFVTFSSGHEAQLAKVSTDRLLFMPGAGRPCEVTLARNQGMYGQAGQEPAQPVQQAVSPVQVAPGPKKIFVGSLPDGCSEQVLRAEFSSFGHITDVYLKQGCEPGRQWAFVTFAAPEQAAHAKEATDRILFLPGAQKACEVMLAKNQGMYGQDSMKGGGGGPHPQAGGPHVVPPTMGGYGGKNGGGGYGKDGGGYGKAPSGQPPPPTTPPPAHLTPWRCYQTAAGLPYYHNHSTGVTQWETPPEFQVADGSGKGKGSGKARYSAY